MLTNGKSARLYKRLVVEEGLASDVSCYLDDRELGGQFNIIVDALDGVELAEVDAAIEDELEKITTNGLTTTELDRVKTSYFTAFIKDLERLSTKSDLLAECETYGDSPDYYKRQLAWLQSATIEQISQTVQTWLSDGCYRLDVLPYPAHSQTEATLDRSQMPPVDPTPLATFPPSSAFTLSNGLEVHLIEQHNLPLIRLLTSIDAGYAADKAAGKAGLAALVGTMLTEGTGNLSATQLSDALNDLGTDLRVHSRLDKTYLSLSSLSNHFDASLALFADVLLHPAFPEASLERERERQLLTIQQEQSNALQLANRLMNGLLYGKNHPYGQPHSGQGLTEQVSSIQRSDLLAFHQNWFKPNNAFIVVAGDITAADLKAGLEKALSAWKTGMTPTKSIKQVSSPTKAGIYLVDKPGAAQSVIMAACLAPSGYDTNWEAFELMNTLLGGSFLSRLNGNLREDKHWTYGVRSIIRQNQGQGAFITITSIQADKTKEGIQEMLSEFTGIRTSKPVTTDEFQAEQTSAVLSVPGEWETLTGLSNALLKTLEFKKEPAWLQQYTRLLQNIDVDDMQKAAKTVVQTDQLIWLIVGDRSTIEAELNALPLGPVTLLNADGDALK